MNNEAENVGVRKNVSDLFQFHVISGSFFGFNKIVFSLEILKNTIGFAYFTSRVFIVKLFEIQSNPIESLLKL